MRNEATPDFARSIIRLVICLVIHPQNVTSPDVTDSSRGGHTGGRGPAGGARAGGGMGGEGPGGGGGQHGQGRIGQRELDDCIMHRVHINAYPDSEHNGYTLVS
jgi:hypothetical protein